MKLFKCLALLAAPPMAGIAVDAVEAGIYYVRQYYSGWHSHNEGHYYYRHYYYKPSPTYTGYRHHYVIYYPTRPKYYYYYNPYKKVYWGRCPVDYNGQEQYSMLAEQDRKGDLAQIPETAFPKPTATPPIPESTDGEKLDLPPDDPPASDDQGLPKTAA